MGAGEELSQDIYGVDVDPFTTDHERRVSHTKAAKEIKRLEILDQRAVIADYLSLDRKVDNLAALVRRLVRVVWLDVGRDNDVAKKAMDYLRREGLEGVIIRTADTDRLPEPTSDCEDCLYAGKLCEHCKAIGGTNEQAN